MANIKLLNLAHDINHRRRESCDSSNHTVIAMTRAEDESDRLMRGDTQNSTLVANSEEQMILQNMDRKRNLIEQELAEISKFMQEYKLQAKRLSFFDNVTKSIVTACSAVASLSLFVGIDQRKDGAQANNALYYTATVCTCIATVLGQLTNTWNLSEKSHNNNTTYKSLHNLHDFISYQILKNHLTSLQLDTLLTDMSTRLMLIRDSASDGL